MGWKFQLMWVQTSLIRYGIPLIYWKIATCFVNNSGSNFQKRQKGWRKKRIHLIPGIDGWILPLYLLSLRINMINSDSTSSSQLFFYVESNFYYSKHVFHKKRIITREEDPIHENRNVHTKDIFSMNLISAPLKLFNMSE